MKRILFNKLLKWRHSSIRKPLLLRGARQVGKTHLVRQFGSQFEHFVEVNFEKNPELIKIFEYNLDPVRISREISLALNKQIIPGTTLLFLDEVQEMPRAIIALRYFYEEMPQLHVIAAGSLIDFAIEKVGVPVGRVSYLYMYPMSFIEFLYATNYKLLAKEIIQHEPAVPFNVAIHEKALRLLGEYMAIGGMPNAVQHWVSNQDVHACMNALQDIKNTYEQDFSKYARKHEIKYVDLLFKQIPRFICQHFNYKNISTDYRKRELEPALMLLEKAGLIHQVISSAGNGLPLGAEAMFGKFKLITLDVALNQAILGYDLKDWFIDPALAFINKGNLVENFVGQELLAYSDPNDRQTQYYWHRENRNSQAEVDYLVVRDRSIIPVEVKSGHGGSLQSLRLFMESHPASPYGIRFSIQDYSVFDHIHNYPLYAVAGTIEDKEHLLQFLED